MNVKQKMQAQKREKKKYKRNIDDKICSVNYLAQIVISRNNLKIGIQPRRKLLRRRSSHHLSRLIKARRRFLPLISHYHLPKIHKSNSRISSAFKIVYVKFYKIANQIGKSSLKRPFPDDEQILVKEFK